MADECWVAVAGGGGEKGRGAPRGMITPQNASMSANQPIAFPDGSHRKFEWNRLDQTGLDGTTVPEDAHGPAVLV